MLGSGPWSVAQAERMRPGARPLPCINQIRGAVRVNLAITYRHAGEPSDVLEVTDIGEPQPPGPGQVQIRVSAFPIHPGDLLAVSVAQAPGIEPVAGLEATGVVTEVGAGVTAFSAGTRVTFFPHQGAC